MPVFWFLIVLAAIALWATLFFIFPIVGKFFSKWIAAIKKSLTDTEENKDSKE